MTTDTTPIDQDVARAFCALFNSTPDASYRAGLAFLLEAYGETEDLALMIKAAEEYSKTPEYVPQSTKEN